MSNHPDHKTTRLIETPFYLLLITGIFYICVTEVEYYNLLVFILFLRRFMTSHITSDSPLPIMRLKTFTKLF